MTTQKRTTIIQMFTTGEDLPLFSGTPQTAIIAPFKPTEQGKQPTLPGFELRMRDAKKIRNEQGEILIAQ